MRQLHRGYSLAITISLATGLALTGCSSGSPTSPSPNGPLALVSADLQVDGQSVNGMTLGPGHGNGEPSFFTAQLMMDGAPAPGQQAWVRYERPMGMMGGSTGQFMLYDDGTNGAPTPGDGIYCFLDQEERYGCQGAGMMDGEYRYEFWGRRGGDGQETNRMQVRVRLDSN